MKDEERFCADNLKEEKIVLQADSVSVNVKL